MSLHRYPEYKRSDIEWTEELPAHWGVASLKWLSKRYSGGTPDKSRPEYWENGNIPWLNSGAVNDGRIYEASAFITQKAFENSSAKWIPSGAIVMALAGQGKTKGMVAQLMIASTCNQSMAAIVPEKRVNARYLYWWLVSNYQNIRNMAGGDLRDGLNLELLGSIPSPLPTLAEQDAIATFLDRETAKIDALMAEQEKLIALLAEKRQATISHAVTRGLNSDAPMKESGVAWLGKVPAHWKVTSFQRYVYIQQGQVDPRQEPFSSMPLIAPNHIDSGTGRLLSSETAREQFAESGKYLCKAGDVLYSKIRPGLRKVCIAPTDCLCSADMYPMRGISGLTNKFLMWFMLSEPFSALAVVESERVAMPKINRESLKAVAIPFPASKEQLEIITFLEKETARLDALQDAANCAISLLNERRSTLITAAVTGQIDVRSTVSKQSVQTSMVT